MTARQASTGLQDFFRANAWGLFTTVVIVAVNYGIAVSKLDSIERRLREHDEQLAQLANVRTMSFQIDMVRSDVAEMKRKFDQYDQSIQKFYKEDWVKVEVLLQRLNMRTENLIQEEQNGKAAGRTSP